METSQLVLETAQNLFNGLAIGSVIALAAVGLTLTCGILRLSNFAHGDFMTLGAYITWLVNSQGLNLAFSVIIGATGTILAMLVSEYLLWKPMRDRRATSTTLIIISIGLALFIRNGILMIWGANNQRYDIPIVPAQEIFGLRLATDRIWAIALAIVAIVILHLVLQRTKIGKAMRAVSDNIDLARVSGINVEEVVHWTWVITAI